MPVTIQPQILKYKNSQGNYETISTLAGMGVPDGGTQGQVLKKVSNTDYDTEWADDAGGTITDVQVNGTSVVSGGVANVPVASNSVQGVVKTGGSMGLDMYEGRIFIAVASPETIKSGVAHYIPVGVLRQHISAFYGLAKAAGADMKDIASTTVGIYPAAQKSAISTMLNAPETVTGTTPTITGQAGISYICGEVATLAITPPASGTIDVRFESGSTPTVLTVPNTVIWPAWFDPDNLEADTVYEINIEDGVYAAVMSWT